MLHLLVLATALSGPAKAADQTKLPAAGAIAIDGSSTVYPLTEAMAEEFQKEHAGIHVTIGSSGTGAGYKKFCAGETDISDGSRGIMPSEVQKCQAAGIEFIELPVAYDGLTVVVNPKNTFVKSLTFDQLKKIWAPGSAVKTWRDVDPSWPDQPLKLYGPSSEHGTFDYFTEVVVGKAKSSRSDYNAASDTNTLVSGVAGDMYALGYFGYAYYLEGKAKVRAVAVAKTPKATPISPDGVTIENGSYPLARPLFITVNKKAALRPEVDAFVRYYLQNAAGLATATGFAPLPAKLVASVQKRYDTKTTGAWQAASH